jgi:hypothetical protein
VGGIIWVLGDVTTDLTLAVERFPGEGGDAFVTDRRMSTGGFGANVGIVLARLGLRPSLIANVGDDEWGRLATKPEPRQITADQTEKLPERSGETIRRAVDEYESRQTAEALCAKDADKLEMLLRSPGVIADTPSAERANRGGCNWPSDL